MCSQKTGTWIGLVWVCLLFRPLSFALADLPWQITTVDSSSDITDTAITLDNQNHPHIGYHDFSNASLKYAAWNGNSWQVAVADDNPDGTGFMPSIGVDSQDRPFISYQNFYYTYFNEQQYQHTALSCARWDGSNWQIQTVDMNGGSNSSLALDANDNILISYLASSDSYRFLKLASSSDGSVWGKGILETSSTLSGETSLALDANGYPHISYYDKNARDLKYTYWDGAAWHYSNVDGLDRVGSYSSLALDASGNPHITYFDDTNEDLKYARWDGSQWQITTVASEGTVGYDPSLALDSLGRPHITYYDNGHLDYAVWNGNAWSFESIPGSFGYYSSLALDSFDNPHISYQSSVSLGRDLMYAYIPEPGTVGLMLLGGLAVTRRRKKNV